MQLLIRSDLIKGITHLTFLADLLLEVLRYLVIPEDVFDPNAPRCTRFILLDFGVKLC
jgi:hypothetical protein